ncbi:hypothetical protein TI39_contig259g00008 [Zymoseptoria brevis]|uniref:Uncharacterized protein n=1 Tax=Zymoseptoria brevis TaxID=1047168 RepID=A0A0F4GXY0_9PEZI|nr:hypothetical protein TI39_contig259g00008 [Zymoseptoria brevis]
MNPPGQPLSANSGLSTTARQQIASNHRGADGHGKASSSGGAHDDKERNRHRFRNSDNVDTAGLATRRGMPPLAWRVRSITNRQDVHGLLEYTVQWESTTHLTADVQAETRDGHEQVRVEGKWWKVDRLTDVSLAHGEPLTSVGWAATTHPVWKLPSAFDAMSAYDRLHPRHRKALDFGRWGLHILDVQDPEPESDADIHGEITGDVLVPQRGVDYTAALLELAERQLANGGLIVPSALQYLNMPRRQRLTFSNSFTDEGKPWDLSQKLKYRGGFVHVAGHAQSTRCSHCVEKGGAFDKCVTFRDAFAGACTNCAVAGRGTSCEYHHKLEWRKNIRPDVMDGDEEEEDEVGVPAEIEHSALDAAPDISALRISEDVPFKGSTASLRTGPALEASDNAESSTLKCTAGSSSGKRKRRHAHEDDDAEVEPLRKRDRADSVIEGTLLPPERLLSSPSPTRSIEMTYHSRCRKFGRACVDPDVGFCLPVNLTDYASYIVYNDEVFAKGELTAEQIKYIISRSPCGLAILLNEAWQDVRDRAELKWYTKWRLFSEIYYDVLASAVKKYCGFRPNTIIDLSDE